MNFEERLHPDLRDAVLSMPDGAAEIWTPENIVTARMPVPPTPDPEVKTAERFIPGPKGAPEVKIKIYEPQSRKENILPGILYLHGGGYAMGSIEMFDPLCNRYVKEVGCVIVSPDYRLAPENPFPAGVEDCYATLEWFASNAEELGVDKNRIAVAGASAGGGLTIAICLMARDRKGPKICFQMPIYPTMDDRLETPSSKEITDGRVLNRQACEGVWNMYLGEGHKTRDISPYAAPARATDLSNLPPAYAFVGELDPHRDEVLDYITRLVQSGVSTGFTLYAGCIHGFDVLIPQAEISERATVACLDALKDAFYK